MLSLPSLPIGARHIGVEVHLVSPAHEVRHRQSAEGSPFRAKPNLKQQQGCMPWGAPAARVAMKKPRGPCLPFDASMETLSTLSGTLTETSPAGSG